MPIGQKTSLQSVADRLHSFHVREIIWFGLPRLFHGGSAMRLLLSTMLSALLVASFAWSDDAPKQAPKIVLKSPDGKKSIDLAKLFSEGPVLVRLTCACSGCDAELKYFQKLQAAYNGKGLHTVAVFREPAESLEQYVDQKGIQFTWLADPKGEMWKTFDSK